MEPLRLFFYREGEHYEYPRDVRQAYGDPVPIPLAPERAAEQGFVLEDNPRAADFLILPFRLDPVICHRRTAYARNFLERLSYFAELERRHVLFDCHDLGQPLCTSACIITDDPARSNREDPFIHSFPHAPYPHVLAAAPNFNFDAIRFDVSFVGALSDPVRLALLESVQREPGLRHYLNAPVAPYWDRSASYLHMKNPARRRPLERLYTGVMQRSWATLCPRGRGSSSIRFFETLCMGRLPVHISDEYTLPLAEDIDYGAFCLFLPEAEAENAGRLVREWLAGKSRAEREGLCRQARKVWEEKLAPAREAELVLTILRRHLPLAGGARASRGVSAQPGQPIQLERSTPLSRLARLAPGCLKDEPPRRVFPAGYFAGMTLDDGRSWFGGAMLVKDGPRPGTVLVDGGLGELPRVGLNLLYHAGRRLPANAQVADLGCGAGVSSIVLANALLSRRNLSGRIFCVESWDAAGQASLAAFWGHTRGAGVDFLLHPLAMPAGEAAGRFRAASLDLVHVNRGCGPAALAPWWDKLRPGAMALLLEPSCAAGDGWDAFAEAHGACLERGGGFVRLRRPAGETLTAACA